MIVEILSQRCVTCRQELPLQCFNVRGNIEKPQTVDIFKRKRACLMCQMKSHQHALHLKRQWHKKNRARVRAYERERYAKDPQHRAYRKKILTQWVEANHSRWLQTKKVYASRRRAAGGEHTWKEWVALVRQWGNKCVRCWSAGNEHSLERDHVISVASGGKDSITNIQPLCRSCNANKHAHTVDYRAHRWGSCPEQEFGRVL